MTQTDPFEMTAEEEMRLEREAIQEESGVKPPVPSLTACAAREWIDALDGGATFDLRQLYEDIGAKGQKDRAAVRLVLHRLKGKILQPHGGRAGCYRKMESELREMNLDAVQEEEADLWLPLDLHNYSSTHAGNVIVVTGDPNAGKTAFMLNTIRHNLDGWRCNYFNSEMGGYELRKRLDLFGDFPIKHPNFHAYERSDNFQDVVQPGHQTLNVIDYLECTDEFYKIGSYINAIHQKLNGAVALIAIQKRDRNSDLPLGGQRALEKPRLLVSLKSGHPNVAKIIKLKNRKVPENMDGKTRPFKLIGGSEFRATSPTWS